MDVDKIVSKAIQITIEFDSVVDGIDFSSYLLEETDPAVKISGGYKRYLRQIKKSQEVLENLQRFVVYKEKEPSKVIADCKCQVPLEESNIKELLDISFSDITEKHRPKLIVSALSTVKYIRLKARMQEKHEKEKDYYQQAINFANLIFLQIDNCNIPEPTKDALKMLYYHELSICYSGLPEASLARGSALRAQDIGKNYDWGRRGCIKGLNLLEVSVLFCIGEAERIGRDDVSALRDLMKCAKPNNQELSTKIAAYQSAANILIDQGRGKEAVELLEIVDNIFRNHHGFRGDYRRLRNNLLIAQAEMDRKELKKATDKLCLIIKRKKEIYHSFAHRKAMLFRLECRIIELMSFEKFLNRSERNRKANLELVEKHRTKIIDCLSESIERRDETNFTLGCRLLAMIYKLKSKNIKDDILGIETNKEAGIEIDNCDEYQLRAYFLLVLRRKLFDKPNEAKELFSKLIVFDSGALMKEALSGCDKERSKLSIGAIENEVVLREFYELYCKMRKSKLTAREDTVLDALKNALDIIYEKTGQLDELGSIEAKYKICTKGGKQVSSKMFDNTAEFLQRAFLEAKPPDASSYHYLKPLSIEKAMYQNSERFLDKLVMPSRQIMPLATTQNHQSILVVLRRWNSFTPSLASALDPSKGGGFFLYHKRGKETSGIIIDPGYDYLDNFFSEGFSVADVNCVVISHNHPDHTDNLPKLLSLFHEMNDRLRVWKPCYRKKFTKEKGIVFIVSRGVFESFQPQFKLAREAIKDIIVVDNSTTSLNVDLSKYEPKHHIKIKAIPTEHADLTKCGSFGFVFELDGHTLGYTGDAKWNEGLASSFKDCNVLCANLGSVINVFKNKRLARNGSDSSLIDMNPDTTKDRIRQQIGECSHLYLSGMSVLLDQVHDNKRLKTVVMSEFGEELKSGIRMDLFHKYSDWYTHTLNSEARCLPGDIGLRIDIRTGDVFCVHCEQYIKREEITPITFGFQEAIFFLCKECLSVFSKQQIDNKLGVLYEKGRLRKHGHSHPKCVGKTCKHRDLCSSAD